MENQREITKQLIFTIVDFKARAFDADFEKKLHGDTTKLSPIEKSYLYFSGLFTEMVEQFDADLYKGKIDERLRLILKEIHYNLCLFVDGFIKLDEIALGKTRPSLLLLFKKTRKIYDYQTEIAGNKIQELTRELKAYIDELYPGEML